MDSNTFVDVCSVQTSRLDVGNFDKEFTSKEPKLSVIDPSIVNKINQDEFCNFSFVNSEYKRQDSGGLSVASSSETTTSSELVASPAAAAAVTSLS